MGILFTAISYSTAMAQAKKVSSKTVIGFDVHALPYITGGCYGFTWVGYNHWQYRAIVTHVRTPQFISADG